MDETIGTYDDYLVDENDIEDFEEYVQYYGLEYDAELDDSDDEIHELYF